MAVLRIWLPYAALDILHHPMTTSVRGLFNNTLTIGTSDRLCDPPNLLSNGYTGLFLRELSGRGVKLTTHLHLVSRSRKCGSIHPLLHVPSCSSA
jgi:hypothetical protein